jgi:hypothetical protein
MSRAHAGRVHPLPEGGQHYVDPEDTMQASPNNRAMQSQLETQMSFMNELASTSYDSARKLSELNLHWAQRFVEGAFDASRQLLACTDVYQLSSAMMGQIQPNTERLRHYQEQLMNVLAGAQVDLTRAAESHLPEAGRSAAALGGAIMRRGIEETDKAMARQSATFDSWNGTAFTRGNGRQESH